jgi:hypothetical protein
MAHLAKRLWLGFTSRDLNYQMVQLPSKFSSASFTYFGLVAILGLTGDLLNIRNQTIDMPNLEIPDYKTYLISFESEA